MTYNLSHERFMLTISTRIILKLIKKQQLANYEKKFIDDLIDEFENLSFEEQKTIETFSAFCELDFAKRNKEQKVH